MLLRALYVWWCTAPLNWLPCYGALEIIVTLLLLLLLFVVVIVVDVVFIVFFYSNLKMYDGS